MEKELKRHLFLLLTLPFQHHDIFPHQLLLSPQSSIGCLLFPIPSSYNFFSHGSSPTLIDNTTRTEYKRYTYNPITSLDSFTLVAHHSILNDTITIKWKLKKSIPSCKNIKAGRVIVIYVIFTSTSDICKKSPTSDICHKSPRQGLRLINLGTPGFPHSSHHYQVMAVIKHFLQAAFKMDSQIWKQPKICLGINSSSRVM